MEKTQKLRIFSLSFFLVLFTVFSLRHYILGPRVAASVDALCPFGGFETFLTWITTGALVPRVMFSSLFLSLGIIITVLIFKRGFCGWICPFGAVQEFLGKIKKNKIAVPKNLDNKLRYLKYIIFIIIILGTFLTGTLIFREYDPFATFFQFGKGIFWDTEPGELLSNLIPFTITLAVLIASIFIERFWCKYLCPLGAVMGILSKLGLTKITKQKGCTNCNLCTKACPVGIDVCKDDHIKSAECISCMQCTSICPKSCLKPKILKKSINPVIYGIFVILIFFSVVFVAKAAGQWQSVPIFGEETKSIENINPDFVKGWMTLDDISKETGISIEKIKKDLSLEDVASDIALKDINTISDFTPENMREYIREKKSSSLYDDIMSSEIETNEKTNSDCPYGYIDDPYPGKCGLYVDSDGSGYCDYSE